MQIRSTGEAEFNHPQAQVFQAAVQAIEGIDHMSIENADAQAGRITAKSSATMWSWGENITLAVDADGYATTTVHVTADPKLFTNVTAGHVDRKDVDEILAGIAGILGDS
jgi:hypothetical protein